MVRLKASVKTELDVIINLFQFLMVRLKDFLSIKAVHFTLISIPYGAIKSNHLTAHFFKHLTFQFLMVRLKAHIFFTVSSLSQISIPYGAIKSVEIIYS